MRRHRARKKASGDRAVKLQELSERWEKQEQFDKKVQEYGDRYGDVQRQKTLESVPKIDTTLGGHEDGTLHD